MGEKRKVLIVGYGYVGKYIGYYFKDCQYMKSDGVVRDIADDENHGLTLENCTWDLAILCLPTPMDKETGRCDTNLIEDAVKGLKSCVSYFMIKSTVEPFTTKRLEDTHGVKICMSPEFTGETLGHIYKEPFLRTFVIFGGKKEVTTAVAEFWRPVLHADSTFFFCTAIEAELIKYLNNYRIMRTIDFWNDAYEVCGQLSASFDIVREGLALDERFTKTHSFIYSDNRGWTGKCLPKDNNALAWMMRFAGNPLKTLEHLIGKNANKWRKDYPQKESLIPGYPAWSESEE